MFQKLKFSLNFCLDKIIMDGTRNYEVNETRDTNIEVTSTLKIKKARKREMGEYECIVKNSIGEATASIRLYRKSLIYIFPCLVSCIKK